MDSRTGRWPVTAILAVLMTCQMCLLKGEEHDMQEKDTGEAAARALSAKLDLLDRLVHEEELVKRISGSSDEEAKQLLAEAQNLWEQAELGFEAGNHATAAEYADRGLKAVSIASRRVVDTGRRAVADRARYEMLRKRVLGFTEAFQRVVIEKPGQQIAGLLDHDEVSRLLHEADQQVVVGNYIQAIERAATAAESVEQALAAARKQDTLFHELKFNTLEDEYDYEKQRNKS